MHHTIVNQMLKSTFVVLESRQFYLVNMHTTELLLNDSLATLRESN